MFRAINLDSGSTAAAAAEKFKENWGDCKVLLLTGMQFDSENEMREFYDEFMELSGVPGEVGEDATSDKRDSIGQATGQRWTEIRYDPSIADAYRHSANAQPLHTDGSYVPGFPDTAIIYCQSAAENGGETVFLDSQILLDIMKDEAPELLASLQSTDLPHARSGLTRDGKAIDHDGIDICLHWNYYCVSSDISSELNEMKEEFHQFLINSNRVRSALVEVPLKTGECVMWKDYRVLHGRNAFDPKRPSERFLWKSAFSA